MGRRTRKPRHEVAGPSPSEPAGTPVPAPAPQPQSRMKARYAKAEARNAQVRETLEPLAPGERPGAVTVAAVVAFVLGLANTAALVFGKTITGSEVTISGIGLSLVLFACAVFCWQARYWAVLGFQALLAIQIVISAGAVLVASTWWAAIVAGTFVLLGGWLFWKLVRALARLQMPAR